MINLAKLVLKNGKVFTGTTFGATGETIGEVCFNTGMTGYQEILTDPSYCGQLVTMTYPHIGNYGVNIEDVESTKIQIAGFIVREENVIPSNFRSTQSLGDYLREQKIVGIQKTGTGQLSRGVGTRHATASHHRVETGKHRRFPEISRDSWGVTPPPVP